MCLVCYTTGVVTHLSQFSVNGVGLLLVLNSNIERYYNVKNMDLE